MATDGYIMQGPMKEMFDIQRMPTETVVKLPPAVVQQFAAIEQLLRTWGLHPDALTHCETALKDLRRIYDSVAYFAESGQSIETGTVWIWPIHVPAPYVRLVQASCPPALVIFAYFAAVASSVQLAWYNLNWSQCSIEGVSRVLGDDMQHWLQWPRAQIKDRMAVLGVPRSSPDAG